MQQQTLMQMLQAAVGHHRAGRLPEAIAGYRQILAQQPTHPDALNLLGVALSQSGQGSLGAQLIRNAIALRPNDPALYHNLSNALHDLGEYDEALRSAQKALALKPNNPASLGNLANALVATGQLDAAIAAYGQSLRLDPSAPEVHRNLGIALLLKGDFSQAWAHYDWRWKLPEFAAGLYRGPEPRWNGCDVRGKTIMLHAEQGFGDVLQFIRYVPVLQQMGAEVIFLCPPELVRLLRCVKDLTLRTIHEPMPPFDFWYPLMSVPHGLGNRLAGIPPQDPPLAADADLIAQWQRRLGDSNGRLRVGLVWAGQPTHLADKRRSISLAQLAPLAAANDVTFYSLQKGPAAPQAVSPPPGMNLIDLTAHLTDFADTAAMMAHLDLIIAVDTAPLHLASAIGKPAWALLPTNGDWRWQLHRADSPWYPSMRLFRQQKPGDWAEVLGRIVKELEKLL